MDHNDAVSQFVGVTGASTESATFFLESSNWDVAAAADQFFAAGGEVPQGGNEEFMEEEEDELVDEPPAVTAPVPAASSAPVASDRRQPSQRGAAARSGLRTLADLRNEEEDDDDEERQDYYAGGEKSGQLIQGPPKPRRDPAGGGGSVDAFFEQARQSGAMDGRPEDLRPDRGDKGPFKGKSRTLAGQAAEAEPPAEAEAAQAVHTIVFYTNEVFTVDDGEPRSVHDPANRPFLESIGRGECPDELAPGEGSAPVTVNLLRSQQPYKPPEKPRHTSFQGTGRRLADAPSSSSGPAAAVPAASTTEWKGADESKPTTSIQLRLHDGSRLVAKFNTSHTVGDIRAFIRASRPDMPSSYQLLTAFPAATLSDDSVTIEAAGLSNAVIIQKL